MTPADSARAARRLTGLSQVKFARLLGVSRSTVQRWENGEEEPMSAALSLLIVIRSAPREAVLALRAEMVNRGAA